MFDFYNFKTEFSFLATTALVLITTVLVNTITPQISNLWRSPKPQFIADHNSYARLLWKYSITNLSDQNCSNQLLQRLSSDPDPDRVCYEWEYDNQTVHHSLSFKASLSPEFWCSVHSVSTQCSDHVEAQNSYHIRSYIICEIIAFDKDDEPCSRGGASFTFFLRNNNPIDTHFNAHYLEGTVIDQFDGHYIGIIYTGSMISNQSNHYTLGLRLDFNAFEGTFNCKTRKVQRIELNMMMERKITIIDTTDSFNDSDTSSRFQKMEDRNKLNQCMINNSHFGYFPKINPLEHYFWIKSNGHYQYIRRIQNAENGKVSVLNLNDKNVQSTAMDAVFNKPKELLWLHFIGRSRTYQLARKFFSILQQHFYPKRTKKRIKGEVRSRDIRQYYYEGAMINRTCSGHCDPGLHDLYKYHYEYRMDVFYHRQLNVLITIRAHDQGIQPNAPKGFNLGYDLKSHHFNASYHLEGVWKFCMESNMEMLSNGLFMKKKKVPDAFIINKGIHMAAFMDNKFMLKEYKTEIRAYFAGIIEMVNGMELGRTVDVIWRRTSDTQFEEENLNPNWICRSPFRMNCLNRLSDDALQEFVGMNNDKIRINVADHWTLSLGRADCVGDNRHYKLGNCCGTMVYDLVQILHSTREKE